MADHLLKGQGGQFPSKYSQLPGISGTHNNSLIPYGVSSSTDMGSKQYDTLRDLEKRVSLSEKSNRAILEEVVRLQSDLKAAVRQNEDFLRNERMSRQQLDASIQSSSELLSQLNYKIKRMEEKIRENNVALSGLSKHSKTVEQVVMEGQQELFSKKDQQVSKIQELEAEVDSVSRTKNQLQRLTHSLGDDIKQVKTKVESQKTELNSIAEDLIQRLKRLEDEQQLALEKYTMRGMQSYSGTNLGDQTESKLSDFQSIISDLRKKQEQEIQNRRSMEQLLNRKVADVESALGEYRRKHEDTLHNVNIAHQEKEHMIETDRFRMLAKVNETVDDISKRMMNNEMKLRDEFQDKFQQFEKLIQLEHSSRMEFEKTLLDDNNKRWSKFKRQEENDIQVSLMSLKMDKVKMKETMQNLNEAISLLEKQFEETKKQTDKIVSAEIKSRKCYEFATSGKLDALQEKVQVASVHLQQTIGSVKKGLENEIGKKCGGLDECIVEQNERTMLSLASMESRLVALVEKTNEMEKIFDSKLEQAKMEAFPENIHEQLESISMWQNATSQIIKDLKLRQDYFPNEISSLDEKYKLLKAEIESRVSTEAQYRTADVEELKEQIMLNISKLNDPMATESDLKNCESGIRKLAESVQTVKTVLGMKIQSEQRLRVDEVKSLQDELIRLRAMIEPLIGRQPRLFVKDPGDRGKAESSTPKINKWLVYNAFRWLTWKSKWINKKSTGKSGHRNKPDFGKDDDESGNKPHWVYKDC